MGIQSMYTGHTLHVHLRSLSDLNTRVVRRFQDLSVEGCTAFCYQSTKKTGDAHEVRDI
jgi:hypothetical protein